MSNPPRRPGLELLIRKPPGAGGQGGGFELKVLDRDEAFLRLRPQRSRAVEVEANAIEEASGLVHVVRFQKGGSEKYLRFTPEEYFLFRHMDGVHTIQDIAAAHFFEFRRFDPDIVRRFLHKARKLGLVEVRRTSLLRSKRVEEERGAVADWLEKLEWKWSRGADRAFAHLAARVGLLYSSPLLPLHLLVAVVGLVVYGTQRFDGGLAAPRDTLVWLGCVLLVLPLSAVVHELGHGLACKAAGRRVKAVGFTFLDDVAPSIYVDVSDMWMAGRAARIGATLGGPATNLVLAAVFTVLAWAMDHDGLSFLLVCAADASLFLVVYTSWPFHLVGEDGYEALTDLTRVPALRGRAWRLLTGWARDTPPDPGLTPRLRALFVGFLFGQAMTAVAVVFFVTWLVVTALKPGSPLL